MKLIEYGTISNGKLTLNNKRLFERTIKDIQHMPVVVTIEKREKKRSVWQNRYYWGVVVPIVQKGLTDVGYEGLTKEDVHEYLKETFNKKTFVNNETGEYITVPESTTNLSTYDFMQYYKKIQKWGDEYLNVYIPDPDPEY